VTSDVAHNLAQTATAPPLTATRRIDLDFVRGVAILLALGWHFNGRDTGLPWLDPLQLPGRTFGWAGVDLFFVLSGFLVGGLIFNEYALSGAFSARRFLVRRAFKIWPVLYLYIALLVLTGRYGWIEVVPQTLFHVQNFFLTPLNHLWSLAVEEHFYLGFAAVFVWFLRRRSPRLTLVPRVLIGLMLIVPLLRCWAFAADVPAHSLQVQTQFRIDAMACGVLLAYLRVFVPTFFAALVRQKMWWALATGCGVLYLTTTRGSTGLLVTIGYTISYITGMSFLLFVYGNRFVVNRNSFARALAWLGTYSYAMYVFQFVAFRAGEALWNRLGTAPIPALAELLIRYVGAIVVAVVITKLLERPLLLLRDRLFPTVPAS